MGSIILQSEVAPTKQIQNVGWLHLMLSEFLWPLNLLIAYCANEFSIPKLRFSLNAKQDLSFSTKW